MPADGERERDLTFSQHLACPTCGTSYDEPAPRNFSFNSPYGACEACDGLGTTFEVDPELVIPDPDQSINGGAIAPWRTSNTQYFTRMLEAVAEVYKLDLDAPYRTLTASSRRSCCTASKATSRSSTRTDTAAPASTPPRTRASSRGSTRRTGAESDWSPRAVRGLHARGALHGMRRRATEAGFARGARSTTSTSPKSATWPSASRQSSWRRSSSASAIG